MNWNESEVGSYCHALASELWPICRSITGRGVRETLSRLKREMPGLSIAAVKSGTRAFDWTVPQEWEINDAHIISPDGVKVVDFQRNNLHVVGYSTAVDAELDLEELRPHLHTLPDQPDAIPYVTSYYTRRWGFCLSQRQLDQLPNGRYKVRIDARHFDGELTYADLLIPGDEPREVLISTYVCHPSMANNELSGPVVATALARWLASLTRRRFTYRFVFVPETIGSIVYISRNLDHLRSHVFAGFNVTCIGDDRSYSYVPSRQGTSISDRAARHVLAHIDPEFKRYRWEDRGSDERQYCSPGVDLPVASIMRSKYGEYPEYHTSLDDLTLVTPSGLGGGWAALRSAIEVIELDCYPKVTVLCEPQLGKRGLYPTLSTKVSGQQVRTMMNLISQSDGTSSMLEIAERLGIPMGALHQIALPLVECGLLELENR
jgi:aminopeptidase-like protein